MFTMFTGDSHGDSVTARPNNDMVLSAMVIQECLLLHDQIRTQGIVCYTSMHCTMKGWYCPMSKSPKYMITITSSLNWATAKDKLT